MVDFEGLTPEGLKDLEQKVKNVLISELEDSNIEYDFVDAEIFNVRTVGVQGDQRTYAYPAAITLKKNGKSIWEKELISRISTRITNEVSGINRVTYVTS